MTADSARLGGIDRDSLESIAQNSPPSIPDDDPVAWEPEWIVPFARWDTTEPNNGCIILLFSTNPSVIAGTLPTSRIVDFANETCPLPGIYIVGKSVTSNSWRLLNSGTDFQANCVALETLNIDKLPTVLLRREVGKLRFYKNGIRGDGQGAIDLDLRRTESSLNLEKIVIALSAFETEQLNSQEMHHRIWLDAAHWIPISPAETTIQYDVMIALRVLFRTFTVIAETNLPIGRTDLFLLSRNEGVATRALLELKVLRSFYATGTAVSESALKRHLMEGRTQARTYGGQVGAAIRLLCSYDMRKEKGSELLDELKIQCENSSVEFKNYPVLNNSASVRESLMSYGA